MNLSDPIADFLTRIRNASAARKRFADIPWSKLKEKLAEILKEQGMIESYQVNLKGTIGTLRIYLKYVGRRQVLNGLKRVSSPGARQYVTKDQIPRFFGGLGIPVLSTSKGLMAGADAHREEIGGELLFLAW